MLEHGSYSDNVSASSLINLPRQALFLNQKWQWIYFYFILHTKCKAQYISTYSNECSHLMHCLSAVNVYPGLRIKCS